MKKRGWQTRKWKLIVETVARLPFTRHRIWNSTILEEDPDEVYNLAEEADDVVARLKADMEVFLQRRLAETGLPDPTVEQEITMRRIGDTSKAVPLEEDYREI